MLSCFNSTSNNHYIILGEHYLPFIDLPMFTKVNSTAISLPSTLPFGRNQYHILYVSQVLHALCTYHMWRQ